MRRCDGKRKFVFSRSLSEWLQQVLPDRRRQDSLRAEARSRIRTAEISDGDFLPTLCVHDTFYTIVDRVSGFLIVSIERNQWF